jgi:predicted Zn finger-like uncharacterized protein
VLTQCPACETVYRLGAADLGSAQGFVECGECGVQFNALERLADESKFPAEQSTAASEHSAAESPPTSSGPAFVLLDSDEPAASSEPLAAAETTASMGREDPFIDLEPIAGQIEQVSLFDPPPPAESELAEEDTPAAAVAEQPVADGGVPEPPILSESEHAILFTDPGAEFGDDTADDIESVDLDEVPAILKAEVAALSRPRRDPLRWLWMSLAGVLIVGLAIQFAGVFRNRIEAALPDTRAVYAAVCERLGCRSEPPGAPAAIELLARDVRDHPQFEDTLLVNATLVSRSKTTAAFPIIQLGLYGQTGEAIGVRRFAPREYLDKSIDLDAGMPPNRPVYIVLEVAGVGNRAVSFEFTFL